MSATRVGGRPVEVVTCETGGDPAGATDCANQLVEQDVLAVTLSQSGVGTDVWVPLHDAGVPTLWFQAGGEIATDDRTSFTIFNPQLTLLGLPLSVAESENADKIAFVVIDVPQALETLDADVDAFTDAAGLDYEAVIETYGQDVRDPDNATAMGGYVAMATLLTSLEEISGEVTTETVVETIKSMPETDLPGGGGMTYRCGWSATTELPSVCTNQWLRTRLDAQGQPTGYEVVDSTDIVSG